MTSRRRPRSSSGSLQKPTRSLADDATPQQPREPDPPPFHFISSKRAEPMWPDRRLLDLFKTEFPSVQSPMAGAMDHELVIAAAQGGALGSLPCAMIPVEKAREQVSIVRQRVSAPINLNFFCHTPVAADPAREAGWKARLTSYYVELGLDPTVPVPPANRAPFDEA